MVECMCDSRNECYIISRARITYIMCSGFEEPDMILHTVIAVFTVTLVYRFGRCIIVLSNLHFSTSQ